MIRAVSIIIFINSIIISSLWAQRFDATMMLDGKLREFIVVKPTGAAPSGGYPLVFMLHGSSGDGEKFFNISKWKEVGEREKIVTVFPSSLSYCIEIPGVGSKMTTKWNNGDLQSVACGNQIFKDDVKFFRKMVDTISKLLLIDQSRIYSAGFSNGGAMTAKLAIEASDLFAALASSSGLLNDLDSARVNNSVPMWAWMGTQDSMFIEASGKPYIPFNDSCLAYQQNPIENYLGSYGLNSRYSKDSTEYFINYEFTSSLPGRNSAIFKYSIVKDLTHFYPNGNPIPVVGAEEHWKFFNQFRKISSVQNFRRINKLEIFPNPTSGILNIQTEEKIQKISIYDCTGKINKVANENFNQIDVSDLNSQTFILKIQFELGKVEFRKFVKI